MAAQAAAIDWSKPAHVVGVVLTLQAEVGRLTAKVNVLKNPGQGNQIGGGKILKELKSFASVPVWDGSDKTFGDFEFKLHQFLAPFDRFEAFLKWIKDSDTPPDEALLNQVAAIEKGSNDNVDIHWMDKESFSLLLLKTEGDPLQVTKSVKEDYAIRGAAAWHKITREVAGKTGARL